LKTTAFFAAVFFGFPVPPSREHVPASQRVKREGERKLENTVAVSAEKGGEGQDPNKTTAKKRGFIHYYFISTTIRRKIFVLLTDQATTFAWRFNIIIFKNLFSYTVYHRTMVVYTIHVSGTRKTIFLLIGVHRRTGKRHLA
jgi:hypothetical protein